ncbi:MAG: class I SAM-dependent methyltransferase [Candidatus Sericytochromatia bacterium]
MTLRELVQSLTFIHCQPTDTVPPFQGHAAERANLRVPAAYAAALEALRPLDVIPAFGSVPLALLLYTAVAEMPAEQLYLNIGVWQGYSLLAGMLVRPARYCLGVDNFSEFGAPRLQCQSLVQRFARPGQRLYEADYRQVLQAGIKRALGVYFYDGPHTAADQRWGLEAALPYLAPGARIFIDDTNCGPAREETLAFLSRHANYTLLADLRTAHNGHPTFWNGVMILEKAS